MFFHFQLNKEKAPRLDCFTIPMYEECWDVIKEVLMGCSWGSTNGIINQSTNVTSITLVPNQKNLIFQTYQFGYHSI